jgi:hypothetical protein
MPRVYSFWRSHNSGKSGKFNKDYKRRRLPARVKFS